MLFGGKELITLNAFEIISLPESVLTNGSSPNMRGIDGLVFTYPPNAVSKKYHAEFVAWALTDNNASRYVANR
jgi:hypothetical protein